MSHIKCLERLWVSHLHNMQSITIQHAHPTLLFISHIRKGREALPAGEARVGEES